ncbi:39S ribosomal protein L18, mitochondrial isoform X2 [Apteryx rowi]|uniref:39S ribosomal protein L18, mitochondrial isoform X2 n=1 Tax=Apteryx rowi TaxID=308060 RepID=UPI000E1CD247|nr:39S ribosomal protein L18, mitochondrial isoform X2 [Apteryx rowi]
MALRSRSCVLLGTAAGRLQTRAAGLRFASTTASLKTESEVDTRENEIVAPDFTNRNPRNLEQLALARKERGWKTTWPKREFWHRLLLLACLPSAVFSVAVQPVLFQCIQFCFIRLRLERTQHYVEAFVECCNGDVVVSASTREWAIKRHLYSPKGVTACKNLGHVMAQRCLEAGINFVNFKAIIPWEHRCDSEFEKAMKEGGVVLYEPRRIYG